MKYNKLVRDRIPEIIEKSGKKAITRTLDDEEYKVFLEKKLDEEVAEFHESKSLEELADIEEVLKALRVAYGYSFEELAVKRIAKVVERGAFFHKTLLLKVEEGANIEQEEAREIPKRLIYESFSPHDCEAWYSCPYCNKKIGSWSLPSSGDVAKGKKMYCPHCKKEVKYPY